MLNRVSLQGRFTHDPEGRATSNGVKYCNFRIACQRDFKNTDGSYTSDFIDCEVWRGTADFVVGHFKKGDMIVLDGRLKVENYKNKEGENRSKYVIAVDNVNLVGSAPRDTQQDNTEPAPVEDTEESVEDTEESTEDSELPFEVG